MDGKKLNELNGNLIDQFQLAEQVLQAYERKEKSFEQVSQEIISLIKLQGEISTIISAGISGIYLRARNAKQERLVEELGFKK